MGIYKRTLFLAAFLLFTLPLVSAASFTPIMIGREACETNEGLSAGCVRYTDNAGVQREVPFYYKLSVTTGPKAEEPFWLDDQWFAYRCDTTDVKIDVRNGDPLNGVPVSLDGNSLATDLGSIDFTWTWPSTVQLSGVTYDVESFYDDTLYLNADGNCQFADQSFANFSSSNILKVNGKTPLNDTMYYDDDYQSIDKLAFAELLDVTNSSLNDTYKYKFYVTDEGQYKKVYLLLGRETNFTIDGAGGRQDLLFNGTDTTGNGIVDRDYYLPDVIPLGFDPLDLEELVAHFTVRENRFTRIRSFIDTASGNLISCPAAGRYRGKVYYNFFRSMCSGIRRTLWGSWIRISPSRNWAGILLKLTK